MLSYGNFYYSLYSLQNTLDHYYTYFILFCKIVCRNCVLLFSLTGEHTLERKENVINEDLVLIMLNFYLLMVELTLNHIYVFLN